MISIQILVLFTYCLLDVGPNWFFSRSILEGSSPALDHFIATFTLGKSDNNCSTSCDYMERGKRMFTAIAHIQGSLSPGNVDPRNFKLRQQIPRIYRISIVAIPHPGTTMLFISFSFNVPSHWT